MLICWTSLAVHLGRYQYNFGTPWFLGGGEKWNEWLEKLVRARERSWGHSLMLTVWKVMEWDHVNAVIRFIFPAGVRFFCFRQKARAISLACSDWKDVWRSLSLFCMSFHSDWKSFWLGLVKWQFVCIIREACPFFFFLVKILFVGWCWSCLWCRWLHYTTHDSLRWAP